MRAEDDSTQGASDETAKPGDIDTELDALAIIVRGFEALPAEARARTYSYLQARFPQGRTTR